jgi:hypothetical protein
VNTETDSKVSAIFLKSNDVLDLLEITALVIAVAALFCGVGAVATP